MDAKEWHSLSAEEALKELGSSVDGLEAVDVATRLKAYGDNTIVEEKEHTPASIVFEQLKNPFVPILGMATVISFIESVAEGGLILFVVALLIGTGIVIESSSSTTWPSRVQLGTSTGLRRVLHALLPMTGVAWGRELPYLLLPARPELTRHAPQTEEPQ